jgi:hypothetical protein
VLNWAPRNEDALGEWRYSSTHSLTSALDGGEWSASRPGRFTPRERAPGIHWIGGWVGPRAVLNTVLKRKIPSPRRESNFRTPIVQPVAQRYTDWAITALFAFINAYLILSPANPPRSACKWLEWLWEQSALHWFQIRADNRLGETYRNTRMSWFIILCRVLYCLQQRNKALRQMRLGWQRLICIIL